MQNWWGEKQKNHNVKSEQKIMWNYVDGYSCLQPASSSGRSSTAVGVIILTITKAYYSHKSC